MKKRLKLTPKPTANATPLPTFLEHIQELRRRLFWIVGVVILASAAAYPFLDAILAALTAPLGGQQLYYLTPIGGLSFSIKVCLYAGLLVAVPCLVYHVYRYFEPLMGGRRQRSILLYLGAAIVLAVTGVLFAYFISLPSALHFLTGMELKNVQAMLTVDSYLGFVMTYLIGAALLFQIPLLLHIINRFTPLKPGKLMKTQRYVVVAAFVVAAIVSPTPDIFNLLLLALPIIGMYEIGVILVWWQNRRPKPAPQPLERSVVVPVIPKVRPPVRTQSFAPKRLDGIMSVAATPRSKPAAVLRQSRPVPLRRSVVSRSLDGFSAYRRPRPVAPS